MLHDIRYAIRMLNKNPGFAAAAILIVALGIGATTAIFSVVYRVALRRLEDLHKFVVVPIPEWIRSVMVRQFAGVVDNISCQHCRMV